MCLHFVRIISQAQSQARPFLGHQYNLQFPADSPLHKQLICAGQSPRLQTALPTEVGMKTVCRFIAFRRVRFP